MNARPISFATAQARYEGTMPSDQDTAASEARDALDAEHIRTSPDAMDQRITKLADALHESPETINQVLIVAYANKLRRFDDLTEWDAAHADGMWVTDERTNTIRKLSKTGADHCQLGKLLHEVTHEAFAKRCVDDAENEVTL